MSLAYHISANPGKTMVMPPIPNGVQSVTPPTLPSVPPEHFPMFPVVAHSDPSKLKVSELNNPFFFPDITTYIIGNRKILNMASNAIQISEGQFGQYPLYVFTDTGIYSMQVGGGEVVYAKESAPTSYEIPITPIVCSTPFGIVFVSARGICLISGQEVVLISGKIQQRPKELNIQSHPSIDNILFNFGLESFVEYIKNIEFIAYNAHENEIILSDRQSDHNWVYAFDSQQFYQSTEKIDLIVENSFPSLYAGEDVTEENTEKTKIKDYSESRPEPAHVSLITRPLTFGNSDFKKLERMFLRAILYNLRENSIIANYFSIDGIHFGLLRGIPVSALVSRKDFDMGLFSRSKYRQFLFAFAGLLDETSQIEYLESEVSKEYKNEKMR